MRARPPRTFTITGAPSRSGSTLVRSCWHKVKIEQDGDNRDKKEKVQRKAREGSKAQKSQKVRGRISRYHMMCLGGARLKREHCELEKLSWATKLKNLETN